MIRALTELTTGVKIREHKLERRNFINRMHVDRNTAAVVFVRAGAIQVNRHYDFGGKTREGFVHGIVHDLKNAVMKTAFIGITNVHVGAFSHALETFEFLDF